MASTLTWLDYSEEHQQKVRALVNEWSQSETVDDLGIGSIRDGISNVLFPGTSVIQTRARYFLFVPWILQHAQTRHPARLIAKAQDMERKLIGALLEGIKQADSGAEPGIIGAAAGKDVKTLPSAIYWAGLARWGIFQRPGLTMRQYERAVNASAVELDPEDEVAERHQGFWHPELPPAPPGFFDFTQADIQLTPAEADWLAERMLATSSAHEPNLLQSLILHLKRGGTVEGTDAAWGGPQPPPGTDPDITRLVWHAERFSSAMLGASLLYNLMLCEHRDELGIESTNDATATAAYWSKFDEWTVEADVIELSSWRDTLSELWSLLGTRGVVIPSKTRDFVEGWSTTIASGPLGDVVASGAGRRLIRDRESAHKRQQSRFHNDKRIRSYTGEAGTGPLTFRWGTVRAFLTDIESARLGAVT